MSPLLPRACSAPKAKGRVGRGGCPAWRRAEPRPYSRPLGPFPHCVGDRVYRVHQVSLAPTGDKIHLQGPRLKARCFLRYFAPPLGSFPSLFVNGAVVFVPPEIDYIPHRLRLGRVCRGHSPLGRDAELERHLSLIRSTALVAIPMAKRRRGRNVSGVQESVFVQCVLWLRSSPWSRCQTHTRLPVSPRWDNQIQAMMCVSPRSLGCPSVCEEEDDKQDDAQSPEPCVGPDRNARAHLHRLAPSCPWVHRPRWGQEMGGPNIGDPGTGGTQHVHPHRVGGGGCEGDRMGSGRQL